MINLKNKIRPGDAKRGDDSSDDEEDEVVLDLKVCPTMSYPLE